MGRNTCSETLALADSPEPLLRLSPGTVAREHVRDGIHGLARLKPCKVGGGLSPGDHTGCLCYLGSPLGARKQSPVSQSKGKLEQGERGERGAVAARNPRTLSPGPDLLSWPSTGLALSGRDSKQNLESLPAHHPQPSRPCNGPLTSTEASVSPVLSVPTRARP